MRWADIEVPNLAVDVNSWARSACYPQRTFYPLSDGPSTQCRRITKTCFRNCSTCESRSKATLYLYTLNTITDRVEVTFVSLRYSLGGDRPSQTTHLTMSSRRQISKLEFNYIKGGISPMAPHRPQPTLLSLPPILRMIKPNTILGYSKGAWGLPVQVRETSVFTGTTSSPSSLLRQCSDRYAIRAGRNLPDKEFRYLRTVIVTAAVYWGFNSMLLRRWHLLLTFQHRAGVTHYTSSWRVCSELCFC